MTPTWFDRIPAAIRHYVIGFVALMAASFVLYASQHIAEWTLTPLESALIAPLIPLFPVLIMGLTTISRQYGVGSIDSGNLSSAGNDTTPPVDAQLAHEDLTPSAGQTWVETGTPIPDPGASA